VLLFSVPLMLPVVLSGQTEMPACCRRSGKHHCGMAGEKNSAGTSLSTSREKCPFSLNADSLAALDKFVVPVCSELSFALLQTHFDGLLPAPFAPSSFRLASTSPRGPPTLSL
jgi:hypothetical protein